MTGCDVPARIDKGLADTDPLAKLEGPAMGRRVCARALHAGSVTAAVAVLVLGALLFPTQGRADYLELRKPAAVYARPDRHSTEVGRLQPASPPIELGITGQIRDGYYPVKSRDGVEGWVHKSRGRHRAGEAPQMSRVARSFYYGGMPNDANTGERITHVENTAYAVGYSEDRWDPLWVAYYVPAERQFSCERRERFLFDQRVESGVTHNDYNNAGYDRGHMAPSSVIGSRFGCEAQDETYFMSNIVPQLPSLNQKPWGAFENMISDTYAPEFGGVWVITGAIFDSDDPEEICSGVEIPGSFFQIVVREVSGRPDALAIRMTQDEAAGVTVQAVRTTIDEIERLTHIDFFAELPDAVENALESSAASAAAWKLSDKLDTNFSGEDRPLCVQPRAHAPSPVDS